MKPGRLSIFWSKREQDFLIRYPRSWDGGFLHSMFCSEQQRHDYETRQPVFEPSFVAQLEARGYDTKTIRFQIDRKPRELKP